MDKNMKYEAAFAELQTIVQQLIKLCKDKLTKTDQEIKKILEDNK